MTQPDENVTYFPDIESWSYVQNFSKQYGEEDNVPWCIIILEIISHFTHTKHEHVYTVCIIKYLMHATIHVLEVSDFNKRNKYSTLHCSRIILNEYISMQK